MKKSILFSLSLLVLFLSLSCNKEKIAFTHPVMKPWFDSHCSSCHGDGGKNTLGWHYRPDDYTASIVNRINVLHRVVVEKQKMPKGSSLSEMELQKFIDWYAAGYPAN